MVAEVIEGALHMHPRPAMSNAWASSGLGARVNPLFNSDRLWRRVEGMEWGWRDRSRWAGRLSICASSRRLTASKAIGRRLTASRMLTAAPPALRADRDAVLAEHDRTRRQAAEAYGTSPGMTEGGHAGRRERA